MLQVKLCYMFISVLYIFLKKKMLQAMFESFFRGKEATLHMK